MGGLHAPSTVRALLERHGLRANKAFGQNFLVDANVLRAIADVAELSREDTAFEIGPGLGVLTRELAVRAGRVVAVELDRRLLAVLEETLADFPNAEVHHGDAMEFDLSVLPASSVMVANLPYNVATPLIARALESGVFRRLVVMIQKEVAERLVADPTSPAYGALSLLVRHFATARIVRHVSPGCFYPPPEVTSSVVRLDVDPAARPAPELFELIHSAFRHRRKTLAKNLQMAGRGRQEVLAALEGGGLDPRIRAEDLDYESFVALMRRLHAGERAGE